MPELRRSDQTSAWDQRRLLLEREATQLKKRKKWMKHLGSGSQNPQQQAWKCREVPKSHSLDTCGMNDVNDDIPLFTTRQSLASKSGGGGSSLAVSAASKNPIRVRDRYCFASAMTPTTPMTLEEPKQPRNATTTGGMMRTVGRKQLPGTFRRSNYNNHNIVERRSQPRPKQLPQRHWKTGPMDKSTTILFNNPKNGTTVATTTTPRGNYTDDGNSQEEMGFLKIVALGRVVSDLTNSPQRPGNGEIKPFSPFEIPAEEEEHLAAHDHSGLTTETSFESALGRPVQRPETDHAEAKLKTPPKKANNNKNNHTANANYNSNGPQPKPIRTHKHTNEDAMLLQPPSKVQQRPTTASTLKNCGAAARADSRAPETQSTFGSTCSGATPQRGTSILDLEEGKDERLTAVAMNLASCNANFNAVLDKVRASGPKNDGSNGDHKQPNNQEKHKQNNRNHTTSQSRGRSPEKHHKKEKKKSKGPKLITSTFSSSSSATSSTRCSSSEDSTSRPSEPTPAPQPFRFSPVACLYNPQQPLQTTQHVQNNNNNDHPEESESSEDSILEEPDGQGGCTKGNGNGCSLRLQPPISCTAPMPESTSTQRFKSQIHYSRKILEDDDSDYVSAAITASQLPDPLMIRSDDNDQQTRSQKNRHLNSMEWPTHEIDSNVGSEVFSDRPSDVAMLYFSDGEGPAFCPKQLASNENSPTGNDKSRGIDVLSDLPSDVDMEDKQRYIKACRLLKNALIQQKHKLPSSDWKSLKEILQPYNNDRTDQNQIPSEDEFRVLENAYAGLQTKTNANHRFTTPDPLATRSSKINSVTSDTEQSTQGPALSVSDIESNVFLSDTMDQDKWEMKATEEQQQQPVKVTPTEASFDNESFSLMSLSSTVASEYMQSPRCIRLHETAQDDSFLVLGKYSTDPGVLTLPILEAFRKCLPGSLSRHNFWLKYSSDQDHDLGTSLTDLLPKLRHSKHSIIGVETTNGDVFGAFCSSAWQPNTEWYGSKQAFLWKLRKSRNNGTQPRKFHFDNELEIYAYVGDQGEEEDFHVQYCSEKMFAVGGGDWNHEKAARIRKEQPVGIGLALDGDLMGGETSCCATFRNPKLCGGNSTEFDIATLEVWTLSPYDTAEESEDLEQLTSALLRGSSSGPSMSSKKQVAL